MDYFILGINLLFFLIVLTLVCYLIYVFRSFRQIVPYVPTPYSIIKRMINLADLQPNDKVVDLGSGSGRLVYRIAKRHQGEVWGIEKSRLLLLVARLRQPFNRKKGQIFWQQADIFTYDLSHFDKVFCFLTSRGMKNLEENFQKMKIGSKIISYTFPLISKENFSQERRQFGQKDKIFVYTKMS